VGFGREAPHVAHRADDLCGQSMGPMPKISVRVVPEASTSASICSFRSAIFRSSIRMLSAGSPKPIHDGRGSWCLAV
jgi:hypothetical protein